MASSLLGVRLSARTRLTETLRVRPGTTTEWLRIPTADAQKLLRAVARLVADLPADTHQDVVWTQGASELFVRTGELTIALARGVVTVGVPVSCDQLREPALVEVPLVVGSSEQPRGLLVATYDTPSGPPEVTDVWAGALTAFAWEAVLTLAQHLAASAGKDRQGRRLVPAAIGAERGVLLVRPMARSEA